LNFFDEFKEKNDLSNYINHCWNAFYYKGEWFFVDVVLGSCSFDKEKIKLNPSNDNMNDENQIININDENKNFTNFNPFFFMSPSEFMINSHLPADDSWQMTRKFCSLKQFLSKRLIDYAKFYKGLFKYDIELLSHQNPFIQINKNQNLINFLKF
jgi:transglutaminase/protease-like cytokinesis protein 3